jgi:glucose/arabinose dehydrogenase
VAYGIRNSFGLAVDPATGNIWFTDNGPSQYDEINRLTVGMNGGWNRIMGPSSRNASELPNLINLRDPPGPGNDVTNPDNYVDPQFSWLSPVGITSLAFLHGSQWGVPYENSVLVGDNNTGRLYRFRLDGSRNAFDFTGLTGVSDLVADNAAEVNQFLFGSGFSVVTDIVRGPDNAIYILNLGTGTVLRLVAVPEPQVWIMMGLSALVLGFAAYRRWMPKPDPDIG